MTLSHISSHPQVRLRSSTNTQGLPHHRLPLMPSQHVSSHVPSRHSRTFLEVSHAARSARGICGLHRSRLGREQHDVCLQAAGSAKRAYCILTHTPEAIDAWVSTLRTRCNGHPIAVCLELNTGPMVSALRTDDF